MKPLSIERYEKLRPIATLAINQHVLKLHIPTTLVQARIEALAGSRPLTVEWLLQLRNQCVLWDVGAHIGAYSILAAKAMRATAIAFEASPLNAAVILRNIGYNDLEGRVSLFCVAVGDRSSVGEISLADVREGAPAVVFSGSRSDGQEKVLTGPAVLMKTLDEIAAEHRFPSPTHLRIAASRNLIEILKGAQVVLASDRLVSVLVDHRFGRSGESQVQEILGELGFMCEKSTESPVTTGSGIKESEYLFVRGRPVWAAGRSPNLHFTLYTDEHRAFLSSFRTALERTDLREDERPHCEIGNSLLDRQLLNRLSHRVATMPGLMATPRSEILLDPESEVFRNLPEVAREVLIEAKSLFGSDELAFLILDKLSGLIRQRFAVPGKLLVPIRTDLSLVRDLQYARKPYGGSDDIIIEAHFFLRRHDVPGEMAETSDAIKWCGAVFWMCNPPLRRQESATDRQANQATDLLVLRVRLLDGSALEKPENHLEAML